MGRVHKKVKIVLIILGSLVLMGATIPLAIWVTHTQTAQLANARARCQVGRHSAHYVVFQNNNVMPDHTVARLCDTLTITNQDNRLRLIAFGPHEHHISYDGISEKLLSQNQSLTVTLVKAGSFTFHDHIDDALHGSFTVQP
jgi:hypothetical protein